MATTSANAGPTPAPSTPTPQQQQAFEHGIWYILSLWPALHVAVRDGWGGPSSSDKKDWFAGAVSDLLLSRSQTDHEDLVVFLLQVMQDEFECNVEDDSEEQVAKDMLALRKRIFEDGDATALTELEQRWNTRGQMKVQFQVVDNGENEDDEDDDEWDGIDDDGDVNMDAAQDIVPDLVPALREEKPQPEVDEDGFTKVTKKKNR
jgi:pre-rRNA-processing protein TSR2